MFIFLAPGALEDITALMQISLRELLIQ